jgi:hypothetical protein
MGDLGVIFVLGTVAVIAVWTTMTIVEKTGNNQLLGLLAFVPVVNVGLVVWLAFSEWPVHTEMKRLKVELATLRNPQK